MISVVLPTYNGEEYIRTSIDSIIKQNIRELELIIVDDASTDGTANIIQEYAEKNNKIKVVHNDVNEGLPKSLNVGFKNTVGEYLTWTSDDNYYLPYALEKMCAYLKDNNTIPMVCANMYTTDIDKNELKEFAKYEKQKMYVENYVGACFMYRREVMETVGEYDPQLLGVEDYDYWLRILKHYGTIGHLDEYLYVYRFHGRSLTSTKAKTIREHHGYLLVKNMDWILDNIQDDRYLLYKLYVRLLSSGLFKGDIRNNLIRCFPELELIKSVEKGKSLILYGAGIVCDKALNEIPCGMIAYIADKSPTRYGGWKDNIPILSLEEVVEIQNDYNVLITVGSKLVYEVMHDLMNAGIKRYCPYDLYLKMKGIEWY